MKRHIPNLLTLANLFAGCCALVFLFSGRPDLAVWCTAASFFFDTFDGVAARVLGVSSPIGKELDSLADVVSFGVAPGAMLFQLLYRGGGAADFSANPYTALSGALPAFVLSAFSALRLAKFNTDTRQTNNFLGLTTPLCTVCILGLTMAAYRNEYGLGDFFAANRWVVYAVTLLFSYLLISELPLLGLKIKSLGWKGNEALLALLAVTFLCVWLLGYSGLPVAVLIYVVYSLYTHQRTA